MNHKAVELGLKAARSGQFGGDGSYAIITTLLHAAAAGADEVFVPRHIVRGLEAAKPFAEIALDHEPAFDEHVEGAINRRDAGFHAAVGECACDILGRQIAAKPGNPMRSPRGRPGRLRSHRPSA